MALAEAFTASKDHLEDEHSFGVFPVEDKKTRSRGILPVEEDTFFESDLDGPKYILDKNGEDTVFENDLDDPKPYVGKNIENIVFENDFDKDSDDVEEPIEPYPLSLSEVQVILAEAKAIQDQPADSNDISADAYADAWQEIDAEISAEAWLKEWEKLDSGKDTEAKQDLGAFAVEPEVNFVPSVGIADDIFPEVDFNQPGYGVEDFVYSKNETKNWQIKERSQKVVSFFKGIRPAINKKLENVDFNLYLDKKKVALGAVAMSAVAVLASYGSMKLVDSLDDVPQDAIAATDFGFNNEDLPLETPINEASANDASSAEIGAEVQETAGVDAAEAETALEGSTSRQQRTTNVDELNADTAGTLDSRTGTARVLKVDMLNTTNLQLGDTINGAEVMPFVFNITTDGISTISEAYTQATLKNIDLEGSGLTEHQALHILGTLVEDNYDYNFRLTQPGSYMIHLPKITSAQQLAQLAK